MKKILSLVCLLLLLNQYLTDDGETPTSNSCDSFDQATCGNKIIINENKLVKCAWTPAGEPVQQDGGNGGERRRRNLEGEGTCGIGTEYETCEAAASLSDVTDDQCKIFETADPLTYCVAGPLGCISATDCKSITANVDEAICNRIQVEEYQEQCTKISDGVGCTTKGKSCGTSLETYSKEICDQLTPTSGSTCYYTGNGCQESTNCESVTDLSLSGDDLNEVCSKFGPDCVGSDNKCVKQTSTSSICTGKDNESCKLIIDSNKLINCAYEDGTCVEKAQYETCSEANGLSTATNTDCNTFSTSEKYCIRGSSGCLEVADCESVNENVGEGVCQSIQVSDDTKKCVNKDGGCEKVTKSCTETLKTYNSETCSQLTPTQGSICYFTGEICQEASSCGQITGSALDTECQKFGQNCVKNGDKCEISTTTESICNGLTGDACTLAIDTTNHILVLCEKSSGTTCQEQKKIQTCTEATELTGVTNEQCNILQTESHLNCIQGTNGCTTSKKKCLDTTYTYSKDICSKLDVSEADKDYICYSDGTQCKEANSCESVIVTDGGKSDLSNICSEFTNCEADTDNNKCKKTNPDECNAFSTQDTCKYATKNDKTLIKCIWNDSNSNNKCQKDGDATEISLCSEATNLNDLTNDQCSILQLSDGKKLCLKGPSGCVEAATCSDINFKVDSTVCTGLTAQDDYNECVINGESGCKTSKKKCLETSKYTYNDNICSNLEGSAEGYYCYSDSTVCKESNFCSGVESTILSGTDLTNFCSNFGDHCISDEVGKKCKIDEEADICSKKSQTECNLIFYSNILFECQWDDTNSECKKKNIYETCSQAEGLSSATEEQCSQLAVEPNHKCTKGDNGCKVEEIKGEEESTKKDDTGNNNSNWLLPVTLMNLVLFLGL